MKSSPLILQKKFSWFFWTQFCGAFNDNAFKQSVIFMVTFTLTAKLPKETADFYVSLGAGVFILPYILFSTWAGTWADKIGKTRVIVITKYIEILIMVLGFAVYWFLNPESPLPAIHVLMVTLFLMGAQSTVFSPAKYGIIPELLDDHELTDGNGLLEMGTFVAILIGTFCGGGLVTWFGDIPYVMSLIFIGIAVTGCITSMKIPMTNPIDAKQRFTLFFPQQIVMDCKHMAQNRVIFLAVMGISFFWFLGAVFLQMIPGLGVFIKASPMQTNFLLISFSIGIGVGSMLCGKLSGGKVEMGLIPFGALGMTFFSILFGVIYPEQVTDWADLIGIFIVLTGIGIFGGFYIVPLNALLQQRTAKEERARMIALNNIINAVFMVGATVFVIAMRSGLDINEPQLIQILGGGLIMATIYVCWLLPECFVRFVIWLLTHSLYKTDTLHRQRIPLSGPVLLVANPLSFVDAFVIQMATHRPIRFVMDPVIFHMPILTYLFRLMGAIPICSRRYPEKYENAFKQIREALVLGEIVCIFPEGQLSRVGSILTFIKGMERIIHETPCKVVPIYLHSIWGSLFTYSSGRFVKEKNMHLPYPVTVTVGQPLPDFVTANEAQEALRLLSAEAMALRKTNAEFPGLK